MTLLPVKKVPVYLEDLGLVCALGDDRSRIGARLFAGGAQSLTASGDYSHGKSLPLGRVQSALPEPDPLPPHEQSRSNQLLLAALAQLQPRLDERLAGLDPRRVGVVLGASTSGIAEGERAMADYHGAGAWPADFDYRRQEMSAPAVSLARWLGAQGPAMTLSTACSSGAKALASARRLLRSDWCDLVIAGGVDSLCQLTVNGFAALESVSESPCVPFSANRDGINIGEGAALFVVSKQNPETASVMLSGVGETSDAHHISAPAPDGRGARRAMELALADAGVTPRQVGYLNLHGTATEQNDRMESIAVNGIFAKDCPCSSTKGYTGHALGAAGAIEAGFCWLTLTQAAGDMALPVHGWDGQWDTALSPLDLVTEARRVPALRYAMSNSFAFGGNNIALLFEAPA